MTLKRAASDLVWAASAKPNRNDRARVIQDLPKLLQRLRQGMALLGIVGEPQEAHIKTIGDTLSDAFLSKTEAIPPAQDRGHGQAPGQPRGFRRPTTARPTCRWTPPASSCCWASTPPRSRSCPTPAPRSSDDMLAWAHELQVGTWFMLDHNDRVSQVQFVWRSDRKQLHLFASSDGRSFLIQVGRLASYLQAGLLVPAEEETLTVRATREALAKLDANPERLLN